MIRVRGVLSRLGPVQGSVSTAPAGVLWKLSLHCLFVLGAGRSDAGSLRLTRNQKGKGSWKDHYDYY